VTAPVKAPVKSRRLDLLVTDAGPLAIVSPLSHAGRVFLYRATEGRFHGRTVLVPREAVATVIDNARRANVVIGRSAA
jgi:hypothetical protein